MAKKKPSRKERQNAVISLFTFPAFIIGFYLLMNGIIEIVGLIVILIIALFIGSWAASYVPDMRKKENKNKNPYTGLPQKNAEKKPTKIFTPQKRTSQDSSNQETAKYNVRPDNEIISLPLHDLNGYEFERLCYLYFKAIGYNPELTPPSQDKGVDLILTDRKEKFKIAVQCKHYINSGRQITVKEIRELVGAKRNHRCIKGWFIATTTYTNAALAEADTHHIDCFAIEFVENKIVAWKEREAAKYQVAVARRK
ncbi:MAG: restriction endonuclease [Anoxybacillus gonensis]|nr:restriction endonuclease [Anoxybacillus gonensis]